MSLAEVQDFSHCRSSERIERIGRRQNKLPVVPTYLSLYSDHMNICSTDRLLLNLCNALRDFTVGLSSHLAPCCTEDHEMLRNGEGCTFIYGIFLL